jgi:hypothetical protein
MDVAGYKQRRIADFGSCAFGVEASKVDGSIKLRLVDRMLLTSSTRPSLSMAAVVR